MMIRWTIVLLLATAILSQLSFADQLPFPFCLPWCVTPTASMTFSSSIMATKSIPLTPTNSLTGSKSHAVTESENSFTLTISYTTITPPLTRSVSVTGSLTETLSMLPSFTETITASQSQIFTLTATQTKTLTVFATMTETITRSGGTNTLTVGFTTSAIPPTTSIPLTTTQTLRSVCPLCVHGYCSEQTEFFCVCLSSTKFGFWGGGAEGGTCEDCARGFYGSDCKSVCPSDTCSPCNGHGSCNDGVTGTGICTCYSSASTGFWTGSACDQCAPNCYGINCTGVCACAHGTCSQGRAASGACTCETGWIGVNCDICDPTLIPNCLVCPNLCSGHGECITQAGVVAQCECEEFFAGEDCSVQCPGQCTNAGHCDDGRFGTGQCSCFPGYAPPACDECLREWYGLTCNETCSCSGHGACGRTDGRCRCDDGYLGLLCNISCVRHDGILCGGHGVCSEGGTCMCYRSSLTGYWGGENCTQCLDGFAGSSCMTPCPSVDLMGTCAGHGTCNLTDGTCNCDETFCGPTCQGQISEGSCSPCAISGFFGLSCDQQCNCVNGDCDDGVYGTGSCDCAFGWAGPRCDVQCDGGFAQPCSGHGTCIVATGACVCMENWSTRNCSTQCPNCGSHGRCDTGSHGTGVCICDPSWVWPHTQCNISCNCSSSGTCMPDLSCSCPEGWAGRCDRCVSGRSGSTCKQRCVYGTTEGTLCRCDTDVGGAECEVRCPTYEGAVCGGTGLCRDGYLQPADCVCFSPFVGPTCQCNEVECARNSDGHATCNAKTGECECTSRWSGQNCDICSRDFWGKECSIPCQCSGHGVCNRKNGICTCEASDVSGHWSGDSCGLCTPGYIGSSCTIQAVSITQLAALQSRYNKTTHQSNITRNMYISHIPPSTLIAGGVVYHAVFTTLSQETQLIAGYSSEKPPFCEWHQNSWVLRGHQYLFGSRGTMCGDLVQLSVYPFLSSIQFAQTIYTSTASVVTTSVMFEQDRVLSLCFTPASTSVLTLQCLQLDSNVEISVPLQRFRTVRAIVYVKSMSALVVGGTDDTDRCAVAHFAYSPETPELQKMDLPFPRNMTQCLAVDCLGEGNRAVVIGAKTPTGVMLGAVNLFTFDSMFVELTMPSAVCTAVAVDLDTNLGLATFWQVSSSVVKFRTFTDIAAAKIFEVYGAMVVGQATLPKLAVESHSRTIFALVKDSAGIVVYRYSLIDVRSVTPLYVDRRGGTEILLTGVGFYQSPSIFCSFGGTVTPGKFIDDSHVVCTSPPSFASCELQPVEVSFTRWSFTTNGIGVKRVEPPYLRTVTPRVLSALENKSVFIDGDGFVPTSSLSCRYADGVNSIVVTAAFLTSKAIVCRASADLFPLFPNASLDVSTDGTLYTGVPVPFTLVGRAAAVVVHPSIVQNASSARTIFATRVIAVITDARGNELRDGLDEAQQRPVQYWFRRSAESANVSRSFFMEDGVSILDTPEFRSPATGDIVVHVTVSNTMTTTFTLRITPGDLASINITLQPASQILAGEAMKTNPRIQLLDLSGNAWIPTTPTFVSLGVRASNGVTYQTFPLEAVSALGDAEWFNLNIETDHGVEYQLVFGVSGRPDVPEAVSIWMITQCAAGQYRFRDHTGDYRCLSCPIGAACNGSSVIVLDAGYWRQNTSVAAVYKCTREDICLGGSAAGACPEGYAGPMCMLCDRGYGQNQAGSCAKCAARGLVILIVIATVFVMFALIIAYTMMCLQFCKQTVNALIMFQILVNFGQALTSMTFLDIEWPAVARLFFGYVGLITDLEMHTLASDCEIRAHDKTYLDKCAFYWSSLLFVPVVAGIIKLLFKFFPDIFLSKEAIVENAKRAKDVEKQDHISRALLKYSMHRAEHSWKAVLSATFQVYLFLSFQTTVNHALNIFKCVDVYRGPKPDSLLVQDFAVDCNSSKYKAAYGFAIFVSAVYGLIVPLAVIVLTALFISRFRADKKHLVNVFLPFQLMGLRRGAWYWQTLVMVRKFAQLSVSIWNPYPLDAYLSAWILNLYTLLAWYIRPYEEDKYNSLEIFASYTLVTTINAGLLYHVTPWKEFKAADLIVMFFLYFVLLILFCYHAFVGLRKIFFRCWGTLFPSWRRAGWDADEDDDVAPAEAATLRIDASAPEEEMEDVEGDYEVPVAANPLDVAPSNTARQMPVRHERGNI